MRRHAQTYFARAEKAPGASLPRMVENDFDAFLECGILAHGCLRPRCDAGPRISARLPHRGLARLDKRPGALMIGPRMRDHEDLSCNASTLPCRGRC